MEPPRLSLVILTLNEQSNIASCLAALARQEDPRFETIVIDAASSDATVAVAQTAGQGLPRPALVVADPRRLAIGEARNLGVSLATTPNVAFLSADAEPLPDWTRRAIQGLEDYSMVFGRQIHRPHRWTIGAAVRGLRYTFPEVSIVHELRWASNVGAAYHRRLLLDHPFEPGTNAAEDLLLAREAASKGATAFYDAQMVVLHHDVADARGEARKNLREGLALGRGVRELGFRSDVVAWSAGLLVAGAALTAWPRILTAAGLCAVAWFPAVRRAKRRRRAMPGTALVAGMLASPAFDLLFAGAYLAGLIGAAVSSKGIHSAQGLNDHSRPSDKGTSIEQGQPLKSRRGTGHSQAVGYGQEPGHAPPVGNGREAGHGRRSERGPA